MLSYNVNGVAFIINNNNNKIVCVCVLSYMESGSICGTFKLNYRLQVYSDNSVDPIIAII